jgi:hypothetical protein
MDAGFLDKVLIFGQSQKDIGKIIQFFKYKGIFYMHTIIK